MEAARPIIASMWHRSNTTMRLWNDFASLGMKFSCCTSQHQIGTDRICNAYWPASRPAMARNYSDTQLIFALHVSQTQSNVPYRTSSEMTQILLRPSSIHSVLSVSKPAIVFFLFLLQHVADISLKACWDCDFFLLARCSQTWHRDKTPWFYCRLFSLLSLLVKFRCLDF